MPYKNIEDKKRYDKEWSIANREQSNAHKSSWKKRNPEHTQARKRKDILKCLYGITLEDYNRMFELQGGRCGICSTETPGGRKGIKNFNVDHDHISGHVRGLLCNKCNRAMGQLGDTIESLEKALEYLKKAKIEQEYRVS